MLTQLICWDETTGLWRHWLVWCNWNVDKNKHRFWRAPIILNASLPGKSNHTRTSLQAINNHNPAQSAWKTSKQRCLHIDNVLWQIPPKNKNSSYSRMLLKERKKSNSKNNQTKTNRKGTSNQTKKAWGRQGHNEMQTASELLHCQANGVMIWWGWRHSSMQVSTMPWGLLLVTFWLQNGRKVSMRYLFL